VKVTHHLFGDESGRYGTDQYFLVGFVKSSDPVLHERQLDEICIRLATQGEIKASSTNRRIVPTKLAWVDYFFSEPGLEFRCLVKRQEHFGLTYFRGNHLNIPAQDMAYNKTYCDLIKHNVLLAEYVLVFLDARNRHANDNIYDYLRTEIMPVADVQPMDSKTSRLLQLADCLVGTVGASLRGKTHSCHDPIERRILNHVQRSGFSSKIGGEKFQVWHWRPR
jgi:hypothetical protein